MPEVTEFLTRLGARKDIMLAVMLLAVVFMMVLPSMILFAAVSFLLGMKHGEYQTT